jgi:hypothetical protein
MIALARFLEAVMEPGQPSTVTRLQAGWQRNLVSIPGRGQDLSLLYSIHTGCGVHPVSHLVGTGNSLRRSWSWLFSFTTIKVNGAIPPLYYIWWCTYATAQIQVNLFVIKSHEMGKSITKCLKTIVKKNLTWKISLKNILQINMICTSY